MWCLNDTASSLLDIIITATNESHPRTHKKKCQIEKFLSMAIDRKIPSIENLFTSILLRSLSLNILNTLIRKSIQIQHEISTRLRDELNTKIRVRPQTG